MTIHHINPKRNAATAWETAGDCLRNSICGSLLKAGALSIGVPADAVDVAKLLAYTARSGGEESRYGMAPADGYKVCHVQVRTLSVVPASGDRASLFSLTATANGVRIYTWTPRQKTGGGRSWYDGYFAITFVNSSLYPQYLTEGKCTIPASDKKAYACRRAKGVNKGLRACGSAVL